MTKAYQSSNSSVKKHIRSAPLCLFNRVEFRLSHLLGSLIFGFFELDFKLIIHQPLLKTILHMLEWGLKLQPWTKHVETKVENPVNSRNGSIF